MPRPVFLPGEKYFRCTCTSFLVLDGKIPAGHRMAPVPRVFDKKPPAEPAPHPSRRARLETLCPQPTPPAAPRPSHQATQRAAGRPVNAPTATSRGQLARCKARDKRGELCGHPCFEDERQAHLRDAHNIDPTARALRLWFAAPVKDE